MTEFLQYILNADIYSVHKILNIFEYSQQNNSKYILHQWIIIKIHLKKTELMYRYWNYSPQK